MGKSDTSHVERHRCPLYTAICVIQGRWKPMIFRRLGESSLGFGELRRTMPGVTIKVLGNNCANSKVRVSWPDPCGRNQPYG
jgi:DNA-binding HxlR family transcriptional regulator